MLLDGRDVTALPPGAAPSTRSFSELRALFPHMNVEKNVAYGLRVRRMDKASIESACARCSSWCKWRILPNACPASFPAASASASASPAPSRARTELLLLDEPLGALDLQLRRQMQLELKRLQKKLGITFVYITHDQEEAINMSDRIAVMRGGRF